ncbi:hypothetical protein THAOC_36373, partial [Thalassiosira oceanica]
LSPTEAYSVAAPHFIATDLPHRRCGDHFAVGGSVSIVDFGPVVEEVDGCSVAAAAASSSTPCPWSSAATRPASARARLARRLAVLVAAGHFDSGGGPQATG